MNRTYLRGDMYYGEESYELCYWGYISFLGNKQKASWCIDKTYDTGDIEDLRSGGWYVEDDIIEDLGFEDCKRLLKDKVFYLPLYLYVCMIYRFTETN